MDDSALYPPNHRALSDSVIGNIVQRVRPSSYAPSSESSALLTLQQKSQFQGVHLTVSVGADGPHQRPPSGKSRQRVTAVDDVSTSTVDEVERRRQRNRLHQARHKMKQRQKVEGLEAAIVQLRAEVQELRLQREVLSTGVMSGSTVWNVAAEYIRVFRYGVKAPGLRAAPIQVETQRNFLKSTMVPDVVSDTGYGVDALIENWGFVTKFHPDIDVQLLCLESSAEGLMLGSTLGRLTITENTLRHAFPHLVNDKEGGEREQLAHRLLGQQLVMRGLIRFEWDYSSGRVATVEHKVDLLTPLLELLGDLEAVSKVFHNARVTPESTAVASGNLPNHELM